jgi:hypothetical protein
MPLLTTSPNIHTHNSPFYTLRKKKEDVGTYLIYLLYIGIDWLLEFVEKMEGVKYPGSRLIHFIRSASRSLR